jgi:hypothetical protein
MCPPRERQEWSFRQVESSGFWPKQTVGGAVASKLRGGKTRPAACPACSSSRRCLRGQATTTASISTIRAFALCTQCPIGSGGTSVGRRAAMKPYSVCAVAAAVKPEVLAGCGLCGDDKVNGCLISSRCRQVRIWAMRTTFCVDSENRSVNRDAVCGISERACAVVRHFIRNLTTTCIAHPAFYACIAM